MGEEPERFIFSSHGTILVALLITSLFCFSPVCGLVGQNYDPLSNPTAFSSDHSNDSASASFTPAGSADVAIVGEPAHVGDSLTASILVHNQGNSSGDVSMTLSSQNWSANVSGEYVTISPGSSREVSTTFSLNQSGHIEIEWEILSLGNVVSEDLSGTLMIEALPPQTLEIIISSEIWTLSEGLHVGISVLLSDGPSRDVEIIAELQDMGVPRGNQVHYATLSHGIRDLSFAFGNPDADSVKFSIVPVGWTTFSDSNLEYQISAPLVSPSVSSCSTMPEIAIPGQSLVIDCTIGNSGNSESLGGTISASRQSDGLILSSDQSLPISAGSESSFSLIIPLWPDDGDSIVEVMWVSGEYSAIQSIQIQTRDPPPDSFSLPFDTSAALLGSVMGLVVVMVVLALWRVISEKTPSTESDGTFQIRRESRIERRSEVQKREIACPSCNQKLSVPANHVGAVKCPSCTTQFRVGEEEVGDIENNLQDITHSDSYEELPQSEKSNEIQNSRSSGEILSCPSCEQRLKVPIEKRPVMSRCPACRTEFMALNEEVPQ
ncbi:MAG: hypothetical protein QGI73_04480 [Candidatus Thalassarchaeaceae archaeon]|jgi:uncharacterized protein YbaR (Trm112 family)|nr:hypothetical protein [Euryarchaeota archaeon]MDP6871470.1 hypothetical protein [Candidatus Thalassarchaeaceae archaeon]|tara:strand:+ start:7293 stop:8939 length:1647 start_codon:yes stop_codon:yes gene_type:complete